MNVFHAAKALGGDISGRNTVLCPGPDHSPKDRSLSVTFNGEHFTVHSHAGDDWRACKDHVRERLGLSPFKPGVVYQPGPMKLASAPDDRERTARARSLWREARPIEGTPAAGYLASRGLTYEGEALRWHPSCPFGKGERHGCMVALVRNIITNKPQAVHRTAIDAQGRKIDRKAYGPIGGGAVKLTDDADVTTVVAVGEGIETALSIRTLADFDMMPVWSLVSAGGIAAFPVLPGIEALWIGADHDGTGIGAARKVARTWMDADREVVIVYPNERGTDLNDVVEVRAHG